MDLSFASIKELRALLDEGKMSSVELTQHFLERIKTLEPEIKAFITIDEEGALKAAKEADKFMAQHETRPMLCGIPYAAKDNFCTKGLLTTAASGILRNYIPPYDSTVIARLREARAVLLGKTNLDDSAHGSSTETSYFGTSKNPWDTNRMPGGSSGGSTAAVAAGMTPWALGTETGGSIRQPASLCGISGLKNTYGRVSRYGIIAMTSSSDSPGPIARSAEDLAIANEAIAGQDKFDSTTGPNQVPAYEKDLDINIEGLKIGIPEEYFADDIDEDVKARVMEGIEELKKLGAETVPVSLPNTRYGSLVYAIITPSEISSNLARYDGIRFGHSSQAATDLLSTYTETKKEGFGEEPKRRILTGTYVLSAGYYDAYYKKAQKVRGLIIKDFNDVFEKVDILACPSVPSVALTSGQAAANPLFGYTADRLNIPASLAGMSAISIPCGFAQPKEGDKKDEIGMPAGLQLIAPQWGEQVLLNTAHAYQSVTDWHKKHPHF